MKNKFRNLFLALVLSLLLPMTMLFVGCGATPSSEIAGILFDTKKYNSEGIALFEVDKGVTTDLTYKIYPSSASSYKVYFDPIDKGTAENSSRFTFQDGKITVNSDKFEDVKYRVRVGEYSDICVISLKEYPIEISTSETEITLNTNEVKAVDIKARFVNSAGVTTERNIDENDFDFLVETSDETIVNVPNPNRLKFIPVRNGISNAKVTVTLLNGSGEKTDLKIEINVKVVQNISEAFAVMSGYNKFVKNGDNIEINFNALDMVDGCGVINFDIYPINTNGVLSKDESYVVYISTPNSKVATLSEDKKSVLVNGSIVDGTSFKIRIIYDDLNMSDGSTFAININLTIKK